MRPGKHSAGRDGLTTAQRQFALLYDGENATAAARAVGVSETSARHRSCLWLQNPKIQKIIRARERREVRVGIKNRQARQEFWSSVMADQDQPMEIRLKASEMLGKSEGDFLVRIDATVKAQQLPEGLTVDEVRRIARLPMSTESDEGEVIDALPVTSGDTSAN